MYEDMEAKRVQLVGRIRTSKTKEAELAAIIRVLQFDADQQKIWNATTSRDYFLRLSDIIADYYEQQDPYRPFK